MRRFPFLFILLISFISNCGNLFSQSPTNIDRSVLYRKEKSYNFILHNEGWGVSYRKGDRLTYFKGRFFESELVGMSHPKETKTENNFFGDARSYVYGQLNSVYVFRTGLGYKKLINDKPYWGGVQVNYTYYLGASVALARPKYLYILNFDNIPPYEYHLTLERYDPQKHFYDNIYGGGPLLKGFEKIKPYPGLYAKFGFNFEFGEYDEKIRAIEVGSCFDYYFSEIPMMAFNKYPNYFLTLYLSVQFGKKYNPY